ncbi:MAG: M6 family metalloprotease domain-containing protein [Candidatus Eisenbacteria bacterium]
MLILVDFTDEEGISTPDYFEDFYTGIAFGADPGKMQHYYFEVSYGQLQVDGEVANGVWHTSSHSLAYYGADCGDGHDNCNVPTYELAREAALLADAAGFNFGPFDDDNDGFVDHVMIVCAGPNQASPGASEDGIWPHHWQIPPPYVSVDGLQVRDFCMLSEESPMCTFAHEFGHDLGAPDLYDYDYDSQDGDPLGAWCLMSGSAGDDHPPHLCGLLKADMDGDFRNGLTGWVVPVHLESEGPYVAGHLDGRSTQSVFITPARFGDEHFVVENRQQNGYYDSSIPEEGILFTHVDMEMHDEEGRFNDGPPVNPHFGAWVERPAGEASPTNAAFQVGQLFGVGTNPDTESNDGYCTNLAFWPTSSAQGGNFIQFEYSSYGVVELLAPNGGESYGIGSPMDIFWDSSSSFDFAKVDVSRDGGDSWTPITSKTDNDGEYTWAVESPYSWDCKIRVEPWDDVCPVGISNRAFTIAPPQTPPNLASGTVDPSTGTVTTEFSYRVEYSDINGDPPAEMSLVVDGGDPMPMSRESGDPADGVYVCSPITLSSGQHTYHFYCSDASGGSDRLPSAGERNGPTVTLPVAYVDAEHVGPENGSQEYPFTDIADALFEVTEPGTVYVAQGTYSGPGNRDLDFQGRSIRLVAVDGRGSVTIDCEGLGRAFHFHSGEDLSSVVDGFTITGGSAGGSMYGGAILCESGSSPLLTSLVCEGNEAESGGAIACMGGSAPLIEDSIVRSNHAIFPGGGIYSQSSGPTIRNTTVEENDAAWGGGIYLGFTTPAIIESAHISRNTAREDGGGVWCSHAPHTFNHVLIDSNDAEDGGGLWCEQGFSGTLTDVVMRGNAAADAGGGMFSYLRSQPVLVDCLIEDNSAARGGGIYCNDRCKVTLADSRIRDNSASDYGGGFYSAESCTLVMQNCDVVADSAGVHGGGIYSSEGCAISLAGGRVDSNTVGQTGGGAYIIGAAAPDLLIEGTSFTANTAGSGGGAYFRSCAGGTLRGSSFLSNEALAGGGAVYVNIAGPAGLVFDSVDFLGNSAGSYGGAICGKQIEGVFRDCDVIGNSAVSGGGMYCGYGCLPRLIDMTFEGNSASHSGGGYMAGDGEAVWTRIENSSFADNTAGVFGGGIYLGSGSSDDRIAGTLLVGNSAAGGEEPERGGGGVYCTHAHPEFADCVFLGNTTDGIGGALVLDDTWGYGGASVTGTTITGNSAGDGGALVITGNSRPPITNTVMSSNDAASVVLCDTLATPTFTRNCIFGNTEGDSLCAAGSHYDNIFMDPFFCDPDSGDVTVWDYSPCLPENNAWGELVGAYEMGCVDPPPEPPLNVAATSAEAVDFVEISWARSPESDMGHYRVERDTTDAFGAGLVKHTTPDTTLVDSGLIVGHDYFYRIYAIDQWGHESDPSDTAYAVCGWTGTGDEELPQRLSLSRNYPNPFNPVTQIAYEVPSPGGRVTLRIHTPSGRLVRTLVDADLEPGTYSAGWDGRDDSGLRAASGVYLCQIRMEGATRQRTMVLLK